MSSVFKRIYFSICFLIFILVMYFAFITFQPIRNVTNSDVSLKTGIVTLIKAGSGGDLYITLKNDPHNYYINNALSHGLSLEKLKLDLLEKEVTLHHINRWTPISTDRVFPHISKLSIGNHIVFNEIVN